MSAEDGFEQIRAGVAVGADQPRPGAVAGIVAVDDGDLVAMAHRLQRVQQVGAQNVRNALQHQSPP